MTQEDKQLLLKDLCARLPYKPRVRYYYSIGSTAINEYSDEGYLSYQNIEDFSIYPKYGLEKTRVYNISPYLRHLSSMTEEEEKEFKETLQYTQFTLESYDWLNAHHFDYRELIERGLALKAPKDMYNNNVK